VTHLYIIGQTRKYSRKDGTEVEYGPYYWLVKNVWTTNGPRIKKLKYLGKYPSPDLIHHITEINQVLSCDGLFDLDITRCTHCIHAEFCELRTRSTSITEDVYSEI